MRTVFTRVLGRRRVPVLLLLAVVLASTTAWAFWAGKSSGSASGQVGSLSAPQISSVTPGGGTVALNWTTVSAPADGTVSYYVSRDGGAASSACPSSTTPGTQTSCTDTGVSTGSHKYTVTAVWRSWTAKSESASAQVTSGAATHLVLTPATTTPTAGARDNLTITAQDASNNTVTSYAGERSLTFGGASTAGAFHPTVTNNSGAATNFAAATAVSFTNGVATVSGASNGAMTLYKAETAKITVTDGTLSNGSGVSVTVGPATASSFTVPTPSTQNAGTAFNETLTALDAYGNTATGYAGSKTIVFSGPAISPGGKAPSYPASLTFTAGVSAAASITLYNAAATTLNAQEGAIAGSSGSFTVNPAAASSLSLAAATTSPSAGEADNLTITALDAYGNTATSYPSSKSLTFGGASTIGTNKPTVVNASGATVNFGSSTPINFSAGVAKVQGTSNGVMKLYKAETANITVADGTSSNGSGLPVTIGAGPATTFTVPTPSSQTAGSAFEVKLTAKDTYGNTATSLTGARTITFTGPTTSPDGHAPKYPATVNFTSGEGAASITIYDAGSMTLTAEEGSVSGSTSSFSVAAASASELELAAASTSPTAGASDNLTITAVDPFGNTATSYGGNKTLKFGGAATSAEGNHPTVVNAFGSTVSFGSNTTISFSSGVAKTSGSSNGVMKLYKAETANITVSDGSIDNGAGLPVTVSPASPASISVSNPGAQTAGVAFSLTITGKDSYGNAVSGSQALSFSGPSSAPDGTAPTYPSTVSFSGGEGKASVTLADAQSTTITAAQGSIKGTSTSFTVSPAGAAELSLLAADETPTAGVSDNLTITAVDSFGNTATTYTGIRNLTFGGAATLGANHPSVSNNLGATVNFGSPTPISFSSGVAKVTGSNNGVMKLYSAETAKVTVSDGSIGNGSGLTLVVSPGTLTISVTNPGTQTAGTAFNLAISAKDGFGNGLSGTQALTFTGPASSPSEKAPSYPSSVTFSAGLGTASIALYNASATTNVTVSQGSVNGSSGNFVVNAGAAAKLAWNSVTGSAGSAEDLCLFTCTWTGLGKNRSWTAKVSVTDTNGNAVSNIGSGHTVTLTGGPSVGSLNTSSLALPSSGTATTSSSVIYSSSNGFWSSDTFTAHSSPYSDATVLLKK
jgi:hypothetical protein